MSISQKTSIICSLNSKVSEMERLRAHQDAQAQETSIQVNNLKSTLIQYHSEKMALVNQIKDLSEQATSSAGLFEENQRLKEQLAQSNQSEELKSELSRLQSTTLLLQQELAEAIPEISRLTTLNSDYRRQIQELEFVSK